MARVRQGLTARVRRDLTARVRRDLTGAVKQDTDHKDITTRPLALLQHNKGTAANRRTVASHQLRRRRPQQRVLTLVTGPQDTGARRDTGAQAVDTKRIKPAVARVVTERPAPVTAAGARVGDRAVVDMVVRVEEVAAAAAGVKVKVGAVVDMVVRVAVSQMVTPGREVVMEAHQEAGRIGEDGQIEGVGQIEDVGQIGDVVVVVVDTQTVAEVMEAATEVDITVMATAGDGEEEGGEEGMGIEEDMEGEGGVDLVEGETKMMKTQT